MDLIGTQLRTVVQGTVRGGPGSAVTEHLIFKGHSLGVYRIGGAGLDQSPYPLFIRQAALSGTVGKRYDLFAP